MDRSIGRALRAAGTTLPAAGDSIIHLVHKAVTGERFTGDPQRALDELVQRDALTPEAALYLAGLRHAMIEIGAAMRP